MLIIESIRAEKKECRVLIGFLGVTGAGKSSLISSLLQMNDLLPADDEKACTAVCVEIIYNPKDDPEQSFHAHIERISVDDWKVELQKLFQDISDQASNKEEENGEADLERDMRIKAAFQKTKCVYPLIKTQKDLKTYTVQALLDHPNVKNILGKPKSIVMDNLEGFSAAIKPYIDSSNSKEDSGKSFAQWPLVKVVRLYVKSQILKDGIVLVDLPGSMDTNAARGAIAENYQKNLSVTCVVAPTQRAASDKPAQELLGKATQMTLQLDNHFSSEHLCFIVSKIDSSLSVDRYIRTHQNVADLLGPVFEKEQEFRSKIEQCNGYYANMKALELKHQKEIAQFNAELRKIAAAFKKENGSKASQQKRKRGSQDEAPSKSMLLNFLMC